MFSSVLRFWLKTLQLARDAAEKLRFHSVGWLRHIFMDFKCSFSVFMSIEFCGSETFTCSVLWEKKWGVGEGKNEKKFSTLSYCPANKLVRGKMRWWQILCSVGDFCCCFRALCPRNTEIRSRLCCAVDWACLCGDGWGLSQVSLLLLLFLCRRCSSSWPCSNHLQLTTVAPQSRIWARVWGLFLMLTTLI